MLTCKNILCIHEDYHQALADYINTNGTNPPTPQRIQDTFSYKEYQGVTISNTLYIK